MARVKVQDPREQRAAEGYCLKRISTGETWHFDNVEEKNKFLSANNVPLGYRVRDNREIIALVKTDWVIMPEQK